MQNVQSGSNMTGTDLCVNKPHCAAAVRPWERVKPQPPPSLLLGLEPVQSCLGVAWVMSNYGYKKKISPGHIWTTSFTFEGTNTYILQCCPHCIFFLTIKNSGWNWESFIAVADVTVCLYIVKVCHVGVLTDGVFILTGNYFFFNLHVSYSSPLGTNRSHYLSYKFKIYFTVHHWYK